MTEENQPRRYRTALIWLAVARAVLGVAALPLAPFLYRDHFPLLVLLRPTKEVLLAGGFFIRRGEANPVLVVAAAAPLAILAVWHFYYLGRSFSEEIRSGEGLPRVAERFLPPQRINKLCHVLARRGRRLIFVGRLASFPSTLLGAAAGASEMPPRRFLPADLAGAVASIAEVVLAGYLLGAAYKKAGPWVTAVGLVLLLALLIALGRSLTRGEDA
ncbi:MAG: VTT domain-containing protein [Actinobacteria bacterium]|nr:VTT domain-containing protein [Actinomycetota bacterium]MBW3649956.1 VTT domain-containing protein [Actinomycetota bacterium]